MYDHVFPGPTTNAAVYRTVAAPIVASAMDGINGTVFACERAGGPACLFDVASG